MSSRPGLAPSLPPYRVPGKVVWIGRRSWSRRPQAFFIAGLANGVLLAIVVQLCFRFPWLFGG